MPTAVSGAVLKQVSVESRLRIYCRNKASVYLTMGHQPTCIQLQRLLQQLIQVFVALLFSWTYSGIFMMTSVGAITTQ